MPIYEYECEKCGIFEVIQKADDKPLKAKPDCCEKNCPKNAHRLISQSAFHLKGGGWYKTDYAKSDTASSGSRKNSDAKSPEASSEKTGKKGTAENKSTEKKSLKVKGGGGGCGSGCGCH